MASCCKKTFLPRVLAGLMLIPLSLSSLDSIEQDWIWKIRMLYIWRGMACIGNKVLLHQVLWKIQSLSVVQKPNTRQEVSFKEGQPRKGVLQTSAAKQGLVQTAVTNESPGEANSKKKLEPQISEPATT